MKVCLSFKINLVLRICWCGLVILTTSAIKAQDFSIRLYTTKDGLPSTYVFGAKQDRLDYLWVGSPEGLSRFDGKSFINYGLSDGLPDTRTTYMFMDSKLKLWMGTARGAGEFRGNRFIGYPLSDSLNLRWVSQIFET